MTGRPSVKASGDEPGAAAQRVYFHLKESIVDGAIPPEAKVSIDTVARDLGLSQTPVREALQKLQSDGLLDYIPGRGYTTTPVLDAGGLDALFEFRFLLEPWAARAAAVDRLSNPAARLNAELRDFEVRIAEGGDLRQVVLAHDSTFHALIMAATGNAVVAQAYEQCHAHLHLFRLFSVDHDGSIALDEHARIASAIEARDPGAAERAMREHLQGSYARSSEIFAGASSSRGLRGAASVSSEGRAIPT